MDCNNKTNLTRSARCKGPFSWVGLLRYTLREQIGEGSTGIVWKAKDHVTGAMVAIKVFFDVGFIPGRELGIALSITNRHVCRVHGYFEDDEGRHCLAYTVTP